LWLKCSKGALVMGQSGSAEAARACRVDRAGFSEAEYAALRVALKVEEDVAEARVDLTAFVSCFPQHLRPLVQPVFFQLGRERVAEPSASWPVLIRGLSGLVRDGATWLQLLNAWAACDEPLDSAACTGLDVELYLELVASLCFWCAYPGLTPSASIMENADGGTGTGSGCSNIGRVVESLRAWGLPSEGTAGTRDSLAAVATRLESQVPLLPRAVGPRFASALLGAPLPPDLSGLDSRVLDAGAALLLRGVDARLWESGAWEPLYRDWRDGRSFNALLKGALHYEGPALLVVRTSTGEVLGALSTCWSDGNGKFAGNSECFLFSLSSALCCMRSGSRAGNYVYLNSRNKHAPRGLGFGGQVGFFRLWLDADFEETYALQSDATYAGGSLVSGEGLQLHFQPTLIEVWGCGGEEAKAAQAAERERVEGVRDQARRVDRAKLLENEFDREMFLQNTFKASEQEKASTT